MKHKDHNQMRGGAAEAPKIARLLTTNEAAGLLGIGKRTLQVLMAERKIPYLRIGRSVRLRTEDIEAFIESRLLKQQGWKGGRP